MKKKYHYPVRTFRLDDRTMERLVVQKDRYGLSWNKVMMLACDVLELCDVPKKM